MNILIINGSPAGDDSITLQTVRYLQKRFPASVSSVPWALRWNSVQPSSASKALICSERAGCEM